MGHRIKNMQVAWDKFNIPPVGNEAVASSTYVDKVNVPNPLIDKNAAKKVASSIENNKNVENTKKDLIKRGKLTHKLNEITDDVELQKRLINRQ